MKKHICSLIFLLSLAEFSAGDKVYSEEIDYSGYNYYELKSSDNFGTFINGESRLQENNNGSGGGFKPPSGDESNEFDFHEVFFVPRENITDGLIGNYETSVDTAMFLYNGEFKQKDFNGDIVITDSIIRNIDEFDDDWGRPQTKYQNKGLIPPSPNECGTINKPSLQCPQIQSDFTKDKLYSLVVTHADSTYRDGFKNVLPLKFFSSFEASFFEQGLIGPEGETKQLSDVNNKTIYPYFDGGTLEVDVDQSSEDFTVTNPEGDKIINKLKKNQPLKLSGIFRGDGGIIFRTQNKNAKTILSGDNTYTGPTIIDTNTYLIVEGSLSNSTAVDVRKGATYEIANTDTIGSLQGNGALKFQSQDRCNDFVCTLTVGTLGTNTEFSGEILGRSSRIVKRGGEKLTLRLSNKPKDVTLTIQEGAIKFSSDINLWKLNTYKDTGIEIDKNSTLTLQNGSSEGSIDGSGDIIIEGTFYFWGADNSHSGLTTIKNEGALLAETEGSLSEHSNIHMERGALALDASNTVPLISGTGLIKIREFSTLTVNQAEDSEFKGFITGNGNFKKSGKGELTLASQNDYTGSTEIDGGTLRITGSLSSDAITINNGILEVTGSLSDSAAVNVNDLGRYVVNAPDVIHVLLMAQPNSNVDINKDLELDMAMVNGGTINLAQDATLKVNWANTKSEIYGTIEGKGGIELLEGASLQLHSADNSYSGLTLITDEAHLTGRNGGLSGNSDIVVENGGMLTVIDSDEVPSISGKGSIVLAPGTLDVNLKEGRKAIFEGLIGGSGGLSKVGSGDLTISGSNTYQGQTAAVSGVLNVKGSLKSESIYVGPEGEFNLTGTDNNPLIPNITITNYGVFDFGGNTQEFDPSNPSENVSVYGQNITLIGTFFQPGESLEEVFANTATLKNGQLPGAQIRAVGGVIDNVKSIKWLHAADNRTLLRNVEGGQLLIDYPAQVVAADSDTSTFNNLLIRSQTGQEIVDRDQFENDFYPGLVLGFDNKEAPALEVTDKFTYEDGNIFLYKPAPESGERADYEGTWRIIDFDSDDLTDEEYAEMFANTYVKYQTPLGDFDYFRFDSAGSTPAEFVRDVELQKGSLVVFVGEENIEPDDKEEIIDGINDIISGGDGSGSGGGSSSGGDGSGSGGGSSSGGSIGSGGGSLDLEDGFIEDVVDDFDLWTRDEVVQVVTRGLLPRNVDGAGQTLATFNNLLTDTVFERTPMRQFTEVEPAVVEAAPIVEPEVVPVGEPVRGLWSKSGEVDDQQADEYLEQTVASSDAESLVDGDAQGTRPLVLADGQGAVELKGDELLVEIDGRTYLEDGSLTAEYAGRDGVRGWFRGFGGRSADSNGESGTLFNPYSISAGGGILGVDVSVSESFQLGAYANYGNINLSQRNGVYDMGGGWNADGWGGGITADYWSNNFYVQGLLGATGFSGEQRRNIDGYGTLFDDETATGEKSATSMVGALRVGAPFQSGNTYIEPQLTATWTGNNENSFSESTDDDRLGLNYKSRNTNYLQTELGVKFAWPIKTGDTGLFTPSVKLAWLGDWNQGNGDQTIGLDFSNKTYDVGSNQEDVNGALIEAGIDYNVAKIEGTTVKGYLRGGAELWGGNRGTNWRASGGVTFQF